MDHVKFLKSLSYIIVHVPMTRFVNPFTVQNNLLIAFCLCHNSEENNQVPLILEVVYKVGSAFFHTYVNWFLATILTSGKADIEGNLTNVWWPPYSQPEKIAPHLLSGTHWVGISRILWMRNRRHIFLHHRVCCKCSFCQHRPGFVHSVCATVVRITSRWL